MEQNFRINFIKNFESLRIAEYIKRFDFNKLIYILIIFCKFME